MDFKDLKRLSVECEGWIRTARLLIQDVMGEDFVFEDASAGFKKGTDKAGSTDSKTTFIEVRMSFQLIFDLFVHCSINLHQQQYIVVSLHIILQSILLQHCILLSVLIVK